MAKTLVIVESPAKARTIGRFLGSGDIVVQASMGHVRDLPERTLGIDVQNNFQPEYELTANGRKVMKSLKTAAAGASEIYLATDPDREGEAIAWHLQCVLKGAAKANFHRITFHEITHSAIDESFKKPGEIAMDLVDAQQARRVLDRLVGYQVSPMLWKSVKRGTSAGRVQSVALRLIVDREREIQGFKPEEYWNLDALFESGKPAVKLKTRLARINGRKPHLGSAEQVKALAAALQSQDVVHKVSKVATTDRIQKPAPPFITSTLQQAAGSNLKFGATQTMRYAQELYEGIDIGNGGPVGLITYMRTDSVNIAKEAQEQARAFIAEKYGQAYVPERPNVYHSRKSAQEAHEAIRPTDVRRTPESLSQYLDSGQLRLYTLIWNRFVASQMASARQKDHVIEIDSREGRLAVFDWQTVSTAADKDEEGHGTPATAGAVCTFRAAARETVFPGYLAVYSFRDIGTEDELDDKIGALPKLVVGQACNLLELNQEQCFTTPPNRYSEASLVKALEQNGVGRPSTFASTIKTILDRDYIAKEKSSLVPTPLGVSVNDFLVQQMPDLFNIGFTAHMEDKLDQVEDGNVRWTDMLREFYEQFQEWMGHRPVTFSVCQTKDLDNRLAELFPDDFKFDEPVEGAQRKYDDSEFIASVRKRLGTSKEVTERQWKALMNVVAKYAEKYPDIKEKAIAFGWGDNIASAEEERQTRTVTASTAQQVDLPEAFKKLLSAFAKVKWKEPVKRGRRVYDDEKFFKSLKRSADRTNSLTQVQIDALQKMSKQYAAQIEDYEALCAELNWNQAATPAEEGADVTPVQTVDPALREAIMAKLAKAGSIEKWNEPTKKGRRTFDDHAFVTSLQEQFERKGELSAKQLMALDKVLAKYSVGETENGPVAAEGATAPLPKPAKPAPEPVGRNCPQCGAPLVKRVGRFGPFVSCSAYPKCRFIEKRS